MVISIVPYKANIYWETRFMPLHSSLVTNENDQIEAEFEDDCYF